MSICPICKGEIEMLAAIVTAPDGVVYHSGCAPCKIIAAQNAQMDHEAICFACAAKKGGVLPDPYVVTCWIGTCMVCGEATGCTSTSDFRWPGGASMR